jgi:hypothetical protein
MFICVHFFLVQFSCVFCTQVIAQMQEIMTGVMVGNAAKETEVQKYKRWQRKGHLTKRLLENQRDWGKKNREPEVVALHNDVQKCHFTP